MTYEEILKESKQLTVKEKSELAAYLLNSIDFPDEYDEDYDSEVDEEYDAETIAELERRYEEVRTGKAVLIDADVVLREIKKKLCI